MPKHIFEEVLGHPVTEAEAKLYTSVMEEWTKEAVIRGIDSESIVLGTECLLRAMDRIVCRSKVVGFNNSINGG